MNKELLQERNKLKKKMPEFIRQDWQKAIRIKRHWRKPEGMHSKMRLKLRSLRRQPSIGFSSPKEVRNLTRDGYKVIIVSNVAQLAAIKDPITIASTVGMRKRIEIVKKAKEMKLKILNIKDLEKFLAEAETSLKQRKEVKKSKLTRKEKAKAERLKKAEKTEEKKAEESPEEKEKHEKEEKRKLLEQKK